jgi:glycosyltransferase involved in cell wall biosynthesis
MSLRLVAVIPAYQCASTIGAVVSRTVPHVGRVLVVDDGSSDDTAGAAAAAGAGVERHTVNQGKGVALQTGIAAALTHEPGLDAVVLLDGDGQHDPSEIPGLVAALEGSGAQLVVGSRWSDPTLIPGERYWTNYIGSKILSRMSGVDLDDSQSGFRVLSADLARRLRLRSRGYAIESEMLLKAARAGAKIVNSPIRAIYEDDGTSHFRPVLDTFRISCAAIYTKVFDDS